MATINGTSGNDTLRGTPTADSIFGFAGNDSLLGLGGNDTLYGGWGNDTLDGGVGIDSLIGGIGNDTYIVNNANDKITEYANAGSDTVRSSVSYTLGSNLENLTLTGNAAINGTGNGLNNTIVGNSANNVLRGAAGNDSLNGGAGNDTLIGTNGNLSDRDTLTGGSGRDSFILGTSTTVFYDDRNSATAGFSDYALLTDFNPNQDEIRLNGKRSDYYLRPSPSGNLPAGTAIFRDKSGEPDELIAIVQGSASLNLRGTYFKFTDDEINLSAINGRNGFVINGINASNGSGSAVSDAGDVNGDGFADLMITAPGVRRNLYKLYSDGESYVVFGKGSGFDASVSLAALDGSNGFTITVDSNLPLGESVTSAGDINGDGFADVIIQQFGASRVETPSTNYVVFGKASGFDANVDLNTLDGSNGFGISWSNSPSNAGDVNGDGFDDLLFGAPKETPDTGNYYYGTGASYVVFGKASGFGAWFDLDTLDGSNGFVINGLEPGDRLGESVSNAGDVNGDGLADVIVGASAANRVPGSFYGGFGANYVIFGKASGFDAEVDLAELNGNNGFTISDVNANISSGYFVNTAGDINNDGFADLIVDGGGKSYIVFGKASGFDANLEFTAINGSNGFVIEGGNSAASAGDVNGDGFDDLIVETNQSSKHYVVFGKASGFGASFNLFDINGLNGVVINRIDIDAYSSSSISAAGDVNGDGFDDLIIGETGANPIPDDIYSRATGASYVVFGRDFTGTVTRNGTNGNDTLVGTDSDDILIGGQGSDRLIGGRGVDVLIGGAGNDTLSFGAIDRRLDGGSGIDTLTVDTSGVTIDLTTLPNNRITGIEIIDLTGTGNNSLNLTRLDLLALSDTTNRLIVNGNAGDSVTSTQQGWLLGGITTLDGILYNQYTSGAATLFVDTDITRTIS